MNLRYILLELLEYGIKKATIKKMKFMEMMVWFITENILENIKTTLLTIPALIG